MTRGACLWLMPAAALFVAAPVAAQTVVDSDRIDKVAVTLYRDPQPAPNADAGWPTGYALVTETRTIRVPAGRAVIRFEGVSQGMMPETAIVTGLPRDVNEKNRDALLLSPAALIDAHLKRRVVLRRTDPVTGQRRAEPAVVESGPDGGVVLTTPAGVEALRCSGLPESTVYARVPEGLSAKPTLSVVTESPKAATVTVQLSYLAQGFDWSATYVARIGGDGTSLDLFAWLTVKNGGSTGFAAAQTQAVAGRLNKEAAAALPASPDPALRIDCWPMDVTSSFPAWTIERLQLPEAPAYWYGDRYGTIIPRKRRGGRGIVPEPAPSPMMAMEMPPPPPPPPPAPAIVATQEDLGDLKLYRIPEPVTVAARSTKQVAMIDRHKVRFERLFLGNAGSVSTQSFPTRIVLRTRNVAEDGLGLPLPAGAMALFDTRGDQPLLIAEGRFADRAVGEEVEIGGGMSNDVRYTATALPRTKTRAPYVVKVTNAGASDALFEFALPANPVDASDTLGKHAGIDVWRVAVPANGEAELRYARKLD
ncbi:DUF4139 domain-containing protein [Sphingomonas sanxanigenens]|uniref:DUF4139 domain-containing protein n=1 Tax=Sphingomonas sanxanigenens DSM 19645 = NX02 TaxID=1123269 RepID=W0AFY0_9SPHN|nr:hypothetical protein [Sphingomonas sanxanigenens]AHE56819.1 hypothetical protein NX02_26085 [Sphingomonas sanxanigenens DSM 19645 = NX02]